ncbi:MAG: ATP-binding protein [Candidatus Izemoplasmatales bacterium]|jgi:two-component system sensor histidine kinase KdpD|nr:ATP-binding protein [Candidatus Izemoplasmatales bacterium]
MKKKNFKKVIITIITLSISSLLAFGFDQFGIRKENIMLIYIVSIMYIILETKSFWYGMFSTFFLVFIFNFLFTDPKYTFVIDDPNYIISIILFSLVSISIGVLMTKLQNQVQSSLENERKINLLYKMSKDLYNAHSIDDIIDFEKKNLSSNLSRNIRFYFKNLDLLNDDNEVSNLSEHQKEIDYSIENNQLCGKNEPKFSDLSFKIFPVKGKHNIDGALLVDCETDNITLQEKEFIQTNLAHLITALEREKIYADKEATRIEMEKEKLKSTLLRSISHDLRTPLTTLQTGTSFLFESFDKIDDETKKSLLLDINNETSRLNEFVENLLKMTKINANLLVINRKKELIEDILQDVYRRVSNRLSTHTLTIEQKKDIEYVYADASLLIQVLTNLVDNAIQHTVANSNIWIKYNSSEKETVFYVVDDGGGIEKKGLKHIFDDFSNIRNNRGDKVRGAGLGLSICKAIVSTHKGIIKADNNDLGGATIEFTISTKK